MADYHQWHLWPIMEQILQLQLGAEGILGGRRGTGTHHLRLCAVFEMNVTPNRSLWLPGAARAWGSLGLTLFPRAFLLAGRMLPGPVRYTKGYSTSWDWVQEDWLSMSGPEEHAPNCGNHRNASSYAYILLISSAIIAHAVVVINKTLCSNIYKKCIYRKQLTGEAYEK